MTLRALCLVDRSDPITELVARKVFEISQSGVRDHSTAPLDPDQRRALGAAFACGHEAQYPRYHVAGPLVRLADYPDSGDGLCRVRLWRGHPRACCF